MSGSVPACSLIDVIRALLFDFDGLIVDTEPAAFESWRKIYAEHGADLKLDDWLPEVGAPSGTFDAIAHLEHLTGKTLDREAVRASRIRWRSELCDQAPLRPGVKRYLADALQLDLKTAIVTRSQDGWVGRHLARLGLTHEWDAIVCATENPAIEKSELYGRALSDLAVQAREAIAFEDSLPGVRAAKRAGIRCVAVPNEITRICAFVDADFIMPSLSHSPLIGILAAFGHS